MTGSHWDWVSFAWGTLLGAALITTIAIMARRP